jgi:hypothetical protein
MDGPETHKQTKRHQAGGTGGGTGGGRDGGIESKDLARELTGDLLCARCGYNLRGLSILGVCAECGLPVKASILATIDPLADEIREIKHPLIVQWGFVLWGLGAFLACVVIWVIRATEILDRLGIATAGVPLWLPQAAVGLVLVSGLGSLVLIHPHDGIRRRDRRRAMLGALCYVPLALAMWWTLVQVDAGAAAVYARIGDIPPERSALRLVAGMSIVGITLLLRPNALRLALRSVLVRTGRVDRQPMTALAAAAGLAMVGDVLHLLVPYAPGASGDLVFVSGVAAIAAGSLLLTVGLFSLLLDVWRIRPLIAAPGIGLVDIFDSGEDRNEDRGEDSGGDGAGKRGGTST